MKYLGHPKSIYFRYRKLAHPELEKGEKEQGVPHCRRPAKRGFGRRVGCSALAGQRTKNQRRAQTMLHPLTQKTNADSLFLLGVSQAPDLSSAYGTLNTLSYPNHG